MLSSSRTYRFLLDSLEDIERAADGHPCPLLAVLQVAESAKFELDRHFGIGNWYSDEVVRVVARAMRGFRPDVPCDTVSKIAAILRSAGGIDALRRPF